MTTRHKLFTVLAGLHLVLAACGAAKLSVLPENTAPGHALRIVRGYTGSDANFGFFAPGVSSTLRPTFTLIDADGKEWTDALDHDMGREAQLRVGSGVGLIGAFPDLTPAFLHNWAATMLGRHPNATTVKIGIEIYEVPPMEKYSNAEELARWVQVFPPPDMPELGVFHRK